MPTDHATFLKQHADIFQDFHDREKWLDTITRYKNYPEKLFPTTLKSHQHQVAALTACMLDHIPERERNFDFDTRKAFLMAWIHDDHEPFMELGDIQSSSEVGRPAQDQERIHLDEINGIESAKRRYPKKVSSYKYGELLMDAAHSLQSQESQFVKMCDKLCGLSEALHELAAGNESFRQSMYDPQAKRHVPAPLDYYSAYFRDLSQKLPLAYRLVSERNIQAFDFSQGGNFPETQYTFWKEAIETYTPEWECNRLFGNG